MESRQPIWICPAIEALVRRAAAISGTLLFISHDAYFIRQIATSVFQVQDGLVTLYPGDYDYYLDKSARDAAGLAGTDALRFGIEFRW